MIRVMGLPLPGRVRGFTVEKDGYYTIVINSNLSRESQLKTYQHELEHIAARDFESHCSADYIHTKKARLEG